MPLVTTTKNIFSSIRFHRLPPIGFSEFLESIQGLAPVAGSAQKEHSAQNVFYLVKSVVVGCKELLDFDFANVAGG